MLSAVKKLKMEIIPGCALTVGSPKTPNIYTVCLSCGGRKLVVPQADRKRRDPSMATILEAFLEEAALFEGQPSYEAWCEDCSYDTDDEISLRQYKQAAWYAQALRHLLGNDLYELSIEEWKQQHDSIPEEEDLFLDDMAA